MRFPVAGVPLRAFLAVLRLFAGVLARSGTPLVPVWVSAPSLVRCLTLAASYTNPIAARSVRIPSLLRVPLGPIEGCLRSLFSPFSPIIVSLVPIFLSLFAAPLSFLLSLRGSRLPWVLVPLVASYPTPIAARSVRIPRLLRVSLGPIVGCLRSLLPPFSFRPRFLRADLLALVRRVPLFYPSLAFSAPCFLLLPAAFCRPTQRSDTVP